MLYKSARDCVKLSHILDFIYVSIIMVAVVLPCFIVYVTCYVLIFCVLGYLKLIALELFKQLVLWSWFIW